MRKKILTITCILLGAVRISAQAVEVYAGHQRAGIDLMWFKNFQDREGQRTPFLFFSRNRANTNYDNAPTAFGSTNAVSYNFKNGVGLVAVGSFLNAGFTPKAGLQYVKMKGDFLFFGWWVADLKKQGNLDLFGMFRWQPALSQNWKGFGQVELFSVYAPHSANWNLTQRIRLGGKFHHWAAGFMADFNQSGRDRFTPTGNVGAFLRHDF